MSKTKNSFLDIKHFEKKCHDKQLEVAEAKRIWDKLDFSQAHYGDSYKMKPRFLIGYNCPNCNTHLDKKFIFDDDKGYTYYIYSCHICGYKYAKSSYGG